MRHPLYSNIQTTPIDSNSCIDVSFLRFTSHFRFRLNFQSCHVTSTKSKKKKGAKSEMHIPYRDSVLTWLLRENLGKIIYPKHAIKTKMKGFFFKLSWAKQTQN